ncbi:glutamate-1-semialdehyde 2,1-aminomutase [Anoxynatronum buryatiense]|uniref:Glutamate-1-semialdehyde 2,1-aminomutase n=2 Tax=Anoxynatronum buryatiense TaxID=489973 RepID=A0AA45WWU9_9CLOT|nr:glutamate-1-semialdehyde 2,1-aminomutase [Anoxynatronum buryatiense]SMP61498.1 glutamate-1-semialdehyde 2,1-aminomutase [Anoxynatronum buryatiense]
MNHSASQQLFQEAKTLMPGGVNSPVRAFSAVGTDPVFIREGNGPLITDVDNNTYLDYVLSWGPMILGHADPDVVAALQNVIGKGTSFGAPTEAENQLASLMIEAVPSLEKVRMVNSGTEAVMSALRLARGYTNRSKIVKFNGNYHGHSDALLVKAGSGLLTHGIPGSPGVPEGVVQYTLTARFNDEAMIRDIFETHGNDIAAVIVEPVAGNMGVVPMTQSFAHLLRSLTSQAGSLLVFDEVMTGFRLAFQGAQSLYGITPDLSCYSKIIGGGLPVGAFGGRKDIMDHMAPEGPVYQAGTLSGNPLAMTAGHATLKKLQEHPGYYDQLNRQGSRLAQGLRDLIKKHRTPAQVNQKGSMLCLFFTEFTESEVTDFESAAACDTQRFARFFRGMLSRGIYLPASQFEAWFLSVLHTDSQIHQTLEAVDATLSEIN